MAKSKKPKKISTTLNDHEKDILNRALKMYADKFREEISEMEAAGKRPVFGKEYGQLMYRELSLKLDIISLPENDFHTPTVFVEWKDVKDKG